MKHTRQFMAEMDFAEDEFEFYGKFTGKLKLSAFRNWQHKPGGKLILVTAITPTRADRLDADGDGNGPAPLRRHKLPDSRLRQYDAHARPAETTRCHERRCR